MLWIAGLTILMPAVSGDDFSAANERTSTMTESTARPADGRAPAGAAPPLAYQIGIARSIVLCTTAIADGVVSYRVQEVWKDSGPSFRVGESLRLDTRVHELLGYHPGAGQDVVLFFVGKGLPADQPVEVLPVINGAIIYAPHDRSVREKLTLAQLRERVMALPIPQEGISIPLRISFIGLKSVPWIALGHNSLAPLLVLFEDHLVQRVIFKKTRKYSEIEYVDVSVTDTKNFEIAYTDSPFTFSCKLKARQDLIAALKLFGRKSVRLGEKAQRLLSDADLER